MARAATTRLEPGQHSIERSVPFHPALKDEDGNPVRNDKGEKMADTSVWILRWRIRLHSGRLLDKTTKGPSKGVLRTRARATAAELLATPGNGTWTPRTSVLDYMEAVTLPAIRAERLAISTTRRYELAYRLLRGECHRDDCKHTKSLAGLSIHDAMRPRTLTDCLEEIARLHGEKNVKHARIVASRYLARKLQTDELLELNPLRDLDLDLSKARKPEQHRGGKALSLEDYQRVIEWLLAADPADAQKPKRGRWTHDEAVRARGQAIDMVLAQATTGLRTSELALRPAADCAVDGRGVFTFWLPATATKTKTSRPVPVLDERVSARLAERLAAVGEPGWPLFPAPSDPSKQWQPRTRDRKVADLYREVAAALDLPVFEFERGHMWRATLNTLLYDALPEATRVRLLGHTEAVNRSHYTAVTSTAAVVEAAASCASHRRSHRRRPDSG